MPVQRYSYGSFPLLKKAQSTVAWSDDLMRFVSGRHRCHGHVLKACPLRAFSIDSRKRAAHAGNAGKVTRAESDADFAPSIERFMPCPQTTNPSYRRADVFFHRSLDRNLTSGIDTARAQDPTFQLATVSTQPVSVLFMLSVSLAWQPNQ